MPARRYRGGQPAGPEPLEGAPAGAGQEPARVASVGPGIPALHGRRAVWAVWAEMGRGLIVQSRPGPLRSDTCQEDGHAARQAKLAEWNGDDVCGPFRLRARCAALLPVFAQPRLVLRGGNGGLLSPRRKSVEVCAQPANQP